MASQITRRATLRAGTSLMIVGAAGMVASQCVPVEAPAATTPIGAMFDRWQIVRGRDFDAESDEARQIGFEAYRDLQERIVAAEPASARDLAIQVYVETDAGDSDMREEFFRSLAIMALGQRLIDAQRTLAPDPFVARLAAYQQDVTAYNAGTDDDDALPDASFGRDLQTGAVKIESAAGAALAVRYVLDDDSVGDTLAIKVLRATLAFLEGRA